MFSDYIVYVDESGDHDLTQVNSPYPIFCLSFCVFNVSNYISNVVPCFQKLKFKYFGDDTVIFHERDIRRSIEAFASLRRKKQRRDAFISELTDAVSSTSMNIVATVIDKTKLKSKYNNPHNPYEIALHLCMERLLSFLICRGEFGKTISVVFERRGANEDKDLEVVFRRICANENHWGYKQFDFSDIDFRCKFVAKAANSTGLQIADLTARPIGMSVLRHEQSNRAFDAIANKVDLKCFP